MPFNDKGEFIRSESRPTQRSTPSGSVDLQSRVVPPGRARVTSSADRLLQQRSQDNASGPDPWEVVGEVIGGLLGILIVLVVLACAIWLVVTFYRWGLIGLAFWLIHSLRKLFR